MPKKAAKNRYFNAGGGDVILFKVGSNDGTSCSSMPDGGVKKGQLHLFTLEEMHISPKWPEITRREALKLIPALKGI